MTKLLDDVRSEIIDLHIFFADWFNGVADRDQWEPRFSSRLSPNFMFMPPEGFVLSAEDVSNSFAQAYGSNRRFKIQIRDVIIRHDMEKHVLATYTEWQTGANQSAHENNARFTTILMEKGAPLKWLHVQETWLPEAGFPLHICSLSRFDTRVIQMWGCSVVSYLATPENPANSGGYHSLHLHLETSSRGGPQF